MGSWKCQNSIEMAIIRSKMTQGAVKSAKKL